MSGWFVHVEGESLGPLQAAELKNLVKSGKIGPQTLIRREDQELWVPASQVRGLFPANQPQGSGTTPDALPTPSDSSHIKPMFAPVANQRLLLLVGGGMGAVIVLLLVVIVLLISGKNAPQQNDNQGVTSTSLANNPQAKPETNAPAQSAPSVKPEAESKSAPAASHASKATPQNDTKPVSDGLVKRDAEAIAALNDQQLQEAHKATTALLKSKAMEQHDISQMRQTTVNAGATPEERQAIESGYQIQLREHYRTMSEIQREASLLQRELSRRRMASNPNLVNQFPNQQFPNQSARPESVQPAKPAPPSYIRAVLDLPGVACGAAVAQSGRSLVVLLKDKDALVVIDIATAQQRELPLSIKASQVAAGGDRAIVYSADRDLLAVYDLISGKELGKTPNPLPGSLIGTGMNEGIGDRALLLTNPSHQEKPAAAIFDLETRRLVGEPQNIEIRSAHFGSSYQWHAIAVDAEFTQAALTRSSVSPSGIYHISLGSKGATPFVYYDHADTHVLAFGPRGLHTSNGIYNLNSETKEGRDYSPVSKVYALPLGSLSIVFPSERANNSSPFDIYDPAGESKLLRWGGWEGFSRYGQPKGLLLNHRMAYNAELKRIALLDDNGRKVAIADFDPLGELTAMGTGYAFATSTPPEFAYAGTTWRYKPTVVASGNYVLKLDAGPEGMRVVDGELIWSVPQSGIDTPEIRVLLSFTCGAASTSQLIKLTYGRQLRVGEREITLVRDNKDNLTADLGQGLPIRFGSSRDGSTAYMWDAKAITRLAKNAPAHDGNPTPLKDEYHLIAFRDGTYICMNANKIDFIEENTGRQIARTPCPGVSFNRMTQDPTSKTTYVTYLEGSDSNQLTQYRIGRLDEVSYKITPLDSGYGQSVAISSDGRKLYANLKGYWSNSVTINGLYGPEGILTRSTSADVVVGYDILTKGLRAFTANERAGGNGYFVLVSPHDDRVCFVSGGGSQDINGYHVPVMDPNNLGSVGTSYRLGAYPNGLLYNPQYDLVAGWNGSAVTLLRASDGKVLKTDIKLLADQNRPGLTAWTWSPDGKNLLVTLHSEESDVAKRRHRLVCPRVPLAEETFEELRLGKLARYVPGERPKDNTTGATVEPEVKKAAPVDPIKRVDVTALHGKNRGDMTTQDVAKFYTEAITLISSDDGTGSGFFIGKSGLVLTCAHVIPRTGRTMVRFNSAGKKEQQTVPAEVVTVDREHDLALLRIPIPNLAVETVKLDLQWPVKMGQDLRIIGNPGLGGRQVLDRTMTEGIVSSPKREIEGLTYIQTSAAINPGTSGSPVFNQQGNVIGVVVLKAAIEGAGFIVSPERIQAFLDKNLK